MVRQLLSESTERLEAWREKILWVLGPNGKIITTAIPDVELIIGPQPDLAELGIEESQNRFNLVTKNFIKVFANSDHPLTLFLDDLQWADAASFSLIREIATDKSISHFFLIGAYRNNEVAAHHPLMLTLEQIRKNGTTINSMHVSTLKENDVNQITSNLLRCDPEISQGLAAIIYDKTMGNPFFVIQFLKILYEDKYLTLDSSGWNWNITTIREMQVTDNVVDLMASKITRLSRECRELIEVCACMGNRFDIDTLATISDTSVYEILFTMDDLITQGLINYSGKLYRFHHDRIQEAAYSLISPQEKKRIHYRIAGHLLKYTPPEKLNAMIFFIADQYNQAGDLITSEEKYTIADLNLKAGIKAKKSNAYASAVDYLKKGMDLLSERAWKEQYDLCYGLYLERMECEYLCRNFEVSEDLFDKINQNARNKIDRAKAFYTLIILYTNEGRISEAINLGIGGTRMFGVHLRANAGKLSVVKELIRFKIWFSRIRVEDIPSMPILTDEDKIWCAELSASVGLPAYVSNPNLFALTVLININRTFRYGLLVSAPFAYMALASLLEAAIGDYRTAYSIGEMAVELHEKIGAKRYACKVYFLFGYMILHWKKPLRECLTFFRKAYQVGLETGDMIYCGLSLNTLAHGRIVMGDNLDDIAQEYSQFKNFIESIKDPFISDICTILTQFLLYMRGQSESPFVFENGDLNFNERVAAMRTSGNLLNVFLMLLTKERSLYLSDQFEEACQVGFEMDAIMKVPIGAYHVPEHYFYRCLSLSAVYANKPSFEKRRILRILRRQLKKMRQWSKLCPANYESRYLLMEAERLKVTGRFKDAVKMYEAAVKSADEHGHTNIKAMANERAAICYLNEGIEEPAWAYINAAFKAYRKWGAKAKVTELEKRYPNIIESETPPVSAKKANSTSTDTGTETTTTLLDLSTVMQISQAISSEIMLDRLLSNIMKMAVVNAGAQRGFLILDTDGVLTIEASREKDEGKVLQSIPLENFRQLSTSIVNYVYRTRENVILKNASIEGGFMNDPYIVHSQCKSILCSPIMSKGKLSGIIYMENNLAINTFTPERLELLSIIASQAAISLENARLFELATTDGLTRLFVHRYFQILLDAEIQRSRRYKQPLALAMIDIDDFKHVNDTYGHQFGDEVLRNVASTIRKNTQEVDITARYGGEEFVVIFPKTNMEEALVAAENIRACVEQLEIPHGQEKLHVTISLGVAVFQEHAMEKEELIRAADAGLYQSKRTGKNRVSIANAKLVYEQ